MCGTFVNSFCMDFNLELFLSSLSVHVMPACVKPGKFFTMTSVLVFVNMFLE